jgi:hypothetical protein
MYVLHYACVVIEIWTYVCFSLFYRMKNFIGCFLVSTMWDPPLKQFGSLDILICILERVLPIFCLKQGYDLLISYLSVSFLEVLLSICECLMSF